MATSRACNQSEMRREDAGLRPGNPSVIGLVECLSLVFVRSGSLAAESVPITNCRDLDVSSELASGQSSSDERLASMKRAASTSRFVSSIFSDGHSITNASGPGGGTGHNQNSASHSRLPPPPPRDISTGPVGSRSSVSSKSTHGNSSPVVVALRTSENCTPNRRISGASSRTRRLRLPG